MIIYKTIKFVIFVACATLIFVFNHQIMAHEGALLNGIVGASMAYYGLEGILIPVITKKFKKEHMKVFAGAINVLLAIIVIFLLEGNSQELRIVCVLWSLWSIMREGEEIFEKALYRIKRHPITSIINLAESIVVIVFSIELIIAHDDAALEHHAHVHLILLGIELMLEVIWEHIDHFEEIVIKKYKRKHHESQNSSN